MHLSLSFSLSLLMINKLQKVVKDYECDDIQLNSNYDEDEFIFSSQEESFFMMFLSLLLILLLFSFDMKSCFCSCLAFFCILSNCLFRHLL